MGTSDGSPIPMFLHYSWPLCRHVWYWWRDDYCSIDANNGGPSGNLYGNLLNDGVLYGALDDKFVCYLQLDPVGLCRRVLCHWIPGLTHGTRNYADSETNLYWSHEF